MMYNGTPLNTKISTTKIETPRNQSGSGPKRFCFKNVTRKNHFLCLDNFLLKLDSVHVKEYWIQQKVLLYILDGSKTGRPFKIQKNVSRPAMILRLGEVISTNSPLIIVRGLRGYVWN